MRVTAFADARTEVSSDVTGIDGRYVIRALPTGVYRVRTGDRDVIHERDYPPTFAGGTDTYADAKPVEAESGTTQGVPDIVTPLNGFISGRIVDAAGRPVSGIAVGQRRLGNTIGFSSKDSDISDSAGRWTLARRNRGEYQVGVTDPTQTYRDGVFDGTTTIDGTTLIDSVPPPDLRAHVAVSPTTSPVLTVTVRPRPPRMGYGTLYSATGTRAGLSTLVGETLTYVPGALTPTTARVDSITWVRGSTPIPGATGYSYTVQPQDAGYLLQVRVVLSSLGEISQQDEVLPTHVPAPPPPPRPSSVSDLTPVVGQVLEAANGRMVTSWQWYRDGRPVVGATRGTYRVSTNDRGSRISVASQIASPGYPVPVMSPSTRLVRKAVPKVRLVARSTRTGRVSLDVQAVAQGLPPTALDGRLRVSRVQKGSDKVLTTRLVDGRLLLTLTGRPPGRYTYYVTVLGDRDRTATVVSRKVSVRVR